MPGYQARKNHFQYKIAERWAAENFGRDAFATEARGHNHLKNKGPSTDVAIKYGQVQDHIATLERKSSMGGKLIIVRTFSDGARIVPRYSFIGVVLKAILQKYKNDNLYFRLEGKNGKADWESKSSGEVQYYQIPTDWIDEADIAL
ncbi:hypothetical protein [Paenibacillus koleovorans]|uniref:hypothetical protein n=1 Tax=Paenibacillus koleovorans TaxID=121608 RepID=UPI000FDBAD03|nr:hypothetical protein [Paenibacillus koleovorans]